MHLLRRLTTGRDPKLQQAQPPASALQLLASAEAQPDQAPDAERDPPVPAAKPESHTETDEPFNPTSAKLQLVQPPRKPDPTTSPTTLGTGRFGGSLPSSG